jgi:carbon storage regulator
MLVLTRRRGEAIHIAGNITVTVLEIHGQQVRVGIDAPPTTHIVRAELRKGSGSHVRAKRMPLKRRGGAWL